VRALAHLAREEHAATAAEFALVLPLLLIFLFGILDVGRFMWEYNEAEKATQMGGRYAVVTDPVLGSGFYDYSFAVNDGVTAGSAVPTADFDSATCDGSTLTCTCVGGSVCSDVSFDNTAFTNILTRMQKIYPTIAASNVTIIYKNVGLGFAGDPNGSDVSPLVTVQLKNLTFQPLTTLLFGASFNMPTISASLTGEDLSGITGN
jgi:Flp pilus assembly protein TadG